MRNALLAVLVVMLGAAPALAQAPKKAEARKPVHHEERARMREDVREAYREREARPERPRPLSPEQRNKLRRDVQDANKEMRR